MDVIKLPKKFRMVCYEIMDGKAGALDTLESFADKYPHQVAAVKAEVAYFNLDYEKALALDLTVLPWLEEWYYSNVSDEHMIAMTVAAIHLHREQDLIEALTKEQARIRAAPLYPAGGLQLVHSCGRADGGTVRNIGAAGGVPPSGGIARNA